MEISIKRNTITGILCIVCIMAMIHDAGAQSCVTPPQGIVAWWSGDQNFSDLIGGNDLVSVGNPQSGVAGIVGNAFDFDGDDRLDTRLSLPLTGSVEFWVQVSALSSAVEGIFATVSSSLSNRLWIDAKGPGGVYDGASLRSNFGNNDSTDIKIDPLPVAFSNGWWVHLAVTFDYSQKPGTFAFYLDGNKVGELTASRTHPDGHITFGGETGSYQTFFFRGKLDEVTVYNRLLTDQEIQDIYYAGASGKCKTSPDVDGDGVADKADNCPNIINPSQTDTLGNGLGDACDLEFVVQRAIQLEADIRNLQSQIAKQQNQISDLTMRLNIARSGVDQQ